MRRFAFFVFLAGLAVWGCKRVESIDLDGDPTDGGAPQDQPLLVTSFTGLDVLLIMDNSTSMFEEQQILSTSIFTLINSLMEPSTSFSVPSVDDIRVAVTTSDMGLSWGGNPYENGDGWPGGDPPSGCDSPKGDDGQFQAPISSYVELLDSTIPCTYGYNHCPTGWTCSATSTIIEGLCQAPGGDGSSQPCPGTVQDYSETTPSSPNSEISMEVACLANQGINGCGFEQPLSAAEAAITRADQASFFREDAMLMILVVSDESDCSIEDGPSLFATDDIQDDSSGHKVNIACGNHNEFLFDMNHFYNAFTSMKPGGVGVIFGAIVGVPPGDDCEGVGLEIGDCLDTPEMQLVEYQDGQNLNWYFENACERENVTHAKPGRRFVELASEKFGQFGYVSSICNENWTPAMIRLAQMAGSTMDGACIVDQLPQMGARCRALMTLPGGSSCPPGLEEIAEEQDAVDPFSPSTTQPIYCAIPRIITPGDCSEVNEASFENDLGWWYCENNGSENFDMACSDGTDNDGDGSSDCDDTNCAGCVQCGGTTGCAHNCIYDFNLTQPAIDLVNGQEIIVRCTE